eukprot:354706_1
MLIIACGFLNTNEVVYPAVYPVAMDTCMYSDQTKSWKYSCTDDTTFKHTYNNTNDCSGAETSTLILDPYSIYDVHCGSGDACDIAHVYYNFYDKAGTSDECGEILENPNSKPFVRGYMPLVINQCVSYGDKWSMYSCQDSPTRWDSVEYFLGEPSCNKTANNESYVFYARTCDANNERVIYRQVIATMCEPV